MTFELTPRELARQDAVTDMLISKAQAEGLSVEREALLNLPSVRMAILTDLGLDQDSALAEVRRIPAVAEQVRRKEVQEQLNRGDSDLHKELDRMNPFQKMAFGRQLEAQKAAQSTTRNENMDAAEEARILLMLRKLDPASRISAARAAGLI